MRNVSSHGWRNSPDSRARRGRPPPPRHLVAEQRVDATKADEPPSVLTHSVRDTFVFTRQLVRMGLYGTNNGAVDSHTVHRCQQVPRRRAVPEDRVADEGEAVDDHETRSRMRRASPRIARSASGSRPAKRTFVTSSDGEQAGPSLA